MTTEPEWPVCPHCGERHEPPPLVHIYAAPDGPRFRKLCPFHRHLCYGTRRDYYDTTHFLFDCGTFWDAGYGVWHEPPEVTKARNRAKYQRRKARRLAAANAETPS